MRTLAAVASGANIGEAAVAFALLSLFRIDAFNLTSFKNLLIFIGLAGVVAPLGSAILGAAAFGPAHGLPWQAVWRNWYAGHALGMIIAASALSPIEPGHEAEEHILPPNPQWWGWLCILASPIFFIVFGSYFGMAPGTFTCVFVAALGDKDKTWLATFVLATVVTVFGVGLFSYFLQVPMPIFTWRGGL